MADHRESSRKRARTSRETSTFTFDIPMDTSASKNLRSRSPARLRSRSPARLRSRSPARPRSRSPAQLRSRSPSRLRSRSPAQLRSRSLTRLPTEFELKYNTQLSRIAEIEAILAELPVDHTNVSLIEVELLMEQLEDIHAQFSKEHSHFELNWPAAFLDHPYFSENVHQQEYRFYRITKLSLGQLKHAIMGGLQSAQEPLSPEIRFQSKLPDISLPTFSGDYSTWPAFRDMFIQIILTNDGLSNIEKLHYLRGCVTEEPYKIISRLPLVGTSLGPSWELLEKRYENKRFLIQSQLDRLMSLPQINQRTAAGLTRLISKISEANRALNSLGVENLGECILVHHVTRHFDRSTAERWETSLENTTEYPRFIHLEKFLTSRARALSRAEASSSTAPKKSSASKKTQPRTESSTASTSNRYKYQCDCCNGGHFMVKCAKFRGLSIPERRKIILAKRLCFNCMGRHSVSACRNTINCVTCSGRHHTMLHDIEYHETSRSATSTKPTAQPSQTSQQSKSRSSSFY